MEADPSGFVERAPALVSLLPDEALSLALARGDAFALRAALQARFEREPSGPHRGTLKDLLADRALFVVAERPPVLGSLLGTGVKLTRLPVLDKQQEPFIATRAVCLLGVPIWPLGEHLVRRGRDGELEVLGRVAAPLASRTSRWVAVLTLGGLTLAGAGAMLIPSFTHEVQLANGLSLPVEVHLEDRVVTVEPGAVVTQQVFSLGEQLRVNARWPGDSQPFERHSLDVSTRAVYNIRSAASLEVADPTATGAAHAFEGSIGNMAPGELMRWRGGWERKVRDYASAGKWHEAAELAKAVFDADASQRGAAEEAARILARTEPKEALEYARELSRINPGEAGLSPLAQDLFMALGHREEAFKYYEQLSQETPDSDQLALLAARVAPPEQQRQAYARVLERFPQSAKALRAMARVRLADGFPKEALELLKEALANTPEDLEDLELRVRTMGSLKQYREASGLVRQFATNPSNRSWELAILAGRLARMAGPTRTQYVTRDLFPSELSNSPEHLAAFALLTGESTVTDKELEAVADPAAHGALVLTRALFNDLDNAVSKATLAADSVLRRLDPETAAVLALELSRRGDAQAAGRVFSSRLSLMSAREPLETYVRSGEVRPDFPLLPPQLLAAAYLVRARVVAENRFVEQAYARWTDSLGGMARRALDADYEEPAYREEAPQPHPHQRWQRRHVIIQIIRGSDPPPPPAPQPKPAPKPEGDRVPRPWPVP